MQFFSANKQTFKSSPSLRAFLFVSIFVFTIIGCIYIYNTGRDYSRSIEADATRFAESAVSFLPAEQVMALDANAGDLEKPEYTTIKAGLVKLKNSNPQIKFTYLFVQKAGRLYFLADSEDADSEDYSPPGQEYYEAADAYREPFVTGKAIVTDPSTDRWGTWVSTLVPVKNPMSGEIIAVLGIDYPASSWTAEIEEQVMHSCVIVVSIILLLVTIYLIYIKNTKLKAVGLRLEESEDLFRMVFAQAPIGIAIVKDDMTVVKMNPFFGSVLGREDDELLAVKWPEITHKDDLEKDLELFGLFKAGEIDSYMLEKRYIRPDGSFAWVNMVITGLHLDKDSNKYHLCIVQDIQKRKIAEAALLESERSKSVLISNLPGMAYRCAYDSSWTMHFLSDGCFELTGYRPESLLRNSELSFDELIPKEYKPILRSEWERILPDRGKFRYEYEIITSSGDQKWVLELGQGVYSETGEVIALEGIVVDISDQKEREAQILYINDHDFMTGQYNRKYFENAKRQFDTDANLPLSILICDINGVRLINDALGQAEGDRLIIETANLLQKCCGEGDLLARTGGDEFSLLLVNADQEKASEMKRRIDRACEDFNQKIYDQARNINLSVGYATKTSDTDHLPDIAKLAEENMYKRKLLDRKSYHSAMLSSIMATMFARSQETEEHAERLAVNCKMIGEKMQFSQKSLDELQLFSMLHDIGKVGIDDRILNKPGRLNEEERSVMKKHPEIGYRIAMSSPELEPVADYILTHHERWDGTGYPQGLKGDAIPLLSRILAVADAYDAMTEDRVYRKALPKLKAIAEIAANAGTQFDPEIADLFIKYI